MTDAGSDDRGAGAEDPERTDAELIDATRGGDRDAFAALWRRHRVGALKVAQSITRRFDPDDLASEAFARVYRALRAGSGPDETLMPYLAATIRNTAATWGSRAKEIAVEDPTAFHDGDEVVPPATERDSLVSTAFHALPERWREALWLSAVEGCSAAEIARTFGISANAAAALTYRAREGMRAAWIQAHLEVVDSVPECRFVGRHLGAYARGGLASSVRARIERHVKSCPRCAPLAREAALLARRLHATIAAGTTALVAPAASRASSSAGKSAGRIGAEQLAEIGKIVPA